VRAGPPPRDAAPKAPRRGLFSRSPKPEEAVAAAPAVAEAEPAGSTLRKDDIPDARAKESFLVRHRRAILLGASLVAIAFMTLNLAMQRLASENAAPTANTVDIAPTSSGTDTGAPASTDPAPATPDKATAKPVSEISSPAPIEAPAVAAADDKAADIPTDPVTTASINPGAAMSFAPATTADPMPAALAATSVAAASQPASIEPAITTAALPSDAVTPTGGNAASPTGLDNQATAAPVDTPAPATLESPVKVEMPPDAVGPQDLRQAGADGDARAQFEIAAIYSEGRAVPQDFKQAEVWYERAAAQGFGPAQYRLGNLYENGKGVGKDLEQARLWYQRAAEAGNRMAMHNLAALYAGGQFGKQDFASAAEWFERAANLGMKDSQFNLGMLYARGLGVTQNLETSYKWFALAATGGDAEASKARDDVAQSLDAAALKRAQGDVAAWKVQSVNLGANFAPLGTWEKNFNPGPAVANKDVVMKVQVALMRLGFDVGTPDGHMGPKTGVAIKAFEQGTGMTQVGQINPRLLAVLGSQPV